MSSIVCSDLCFRWSDGESVLDGFDLKIGPGLTGLVAPNGTGKSTLLRLIAGQLAPTKGTVNVAGSVGYLPQDLPLRATRTVDEVLGIAPVRRALAAIESGDVAPEHFATVGDEWDVAERARVALDRLGLEDIGLDRRIGSLSGGEAMLVALSAVLLRRPDVLLLDEPTNNLDIHARERLYRAVEEWPGVLVVVSHDRALLELVDRIVDIGSGAAKTYGGNFTAYQDTLAAEQEAAERAVRNAEADVRRQRRELIEARVKLDRRARKGRKQEAEARFPKVLAQERKRQAQVSAGKLRQGHEADVDAARERLNEAEEAVRDDAEIRVKLPATLVPTGRSVLVARAARAAWLDLEFTLEVRGPERIALLGANGTGKTTLLRLITGHLAPAAGTVTSHVPVRYLPQRLDIVDDELTVLDNVQRHAPRGDINAVRAQLARLLFRGAAAEQTVGTLSGGERFRAALATLLCAEPAPQLLLLDEPTNNLDIASVRHVEQALLAYQGALLVASHDLPFLRSIGITRWLRLDPGTGLTDAPELAHSGT
ncbi:MAG: ABC-F family ATP-binding cassette domain-containing protein [Micromonosporaceae bacterium]